MTQLSFLAQHHSIITALSIMAKLLPALAETCSLITTYPILMCDPCRQSAWCHCHCLHHGICVMVLLVTSTPQHKCLCWLKHKKLSINNAYQTSVCDLCRWSAWCCHYCWNHGIMMYCWHQLKWKRAVNPWLLIWFWCVIYLDDQHDITVIAGTTLWASWYYCWCYCHSFTSSIGSNNKRGCQ